MSDTLNAVAPSTPQSALAAMRAANDRLVDDHVRMFQSMPLRDRLEFIFRTQVALSIQVAQLTAHLPRQH